MHCVVFIYIILNYDNYENLKSTKGVYLYHNKCPYVIL